MILNLFDAVFRFVAPGVLAGNVHFHPDDVGRQYACYRTSCRGR